MDTLYDWLIKNTGNAHLLGNEGQYFTILNVQRETTPNGTEGLDVMVRNQQFKVLNLLVYPDTGSDLDTGELRGRTLLDSYAFADESAVTTYLSDGKTPDEASPTDTTHYRVLVLEPTEAAGQVTFPPTATE